MVGHTSLSTLKTDPAVCLYAVAVLFAMLRNCAVTANTARQHSTLKTQFGSWLSLCRAVVGSFATSETALPRVVVVHDFVLINVFCFDNGGLVLFIMLDRVWWLAKLN